MNKAAEHLLENWSGWQQPSQGALNSTTAATAAGKIASNILSLMEEKKIKLDLICIVCFSKVYFFKHMKWIQIVDKRSKGHGYVARHMPVRTYIIVTELKKLANTWETSQAFKPFVDHTKDICSAVRDDGEKNTGVRHTVKEDGRFRSLDNDWTYQDMKNQVRLFFVVASSSARKHFETEWVNPMLHFAVVS